MRNAIGIRRETKDKTQRRAPLSPAQVRVLVRKHGVRVFVEPWERRVFLDRDYEKAGATLTTNLSKSNIVFGVKEVAPQYLIDKMAYCFFSHTIKGQSYNMPMLEEILKKGATLFDYELVRDDGGKRLIFFGDYAGYAGMIDSLWALGKRLCSEGIDNPFSRIRYATEYERLDEAKEAFRDVAVEIRRRGLPEQIVPFVCGFTGYGHVSTSAQKLFDLLPTVDLEPEELPGLFGDGTFSNRVLYKVTFRKPDMFEHKAGTAFAVGDFRKHPDMYKSRFEQFVPYLSMIVNGIYWEPRFPRLVTKAFMKDLYLRSQHQRLKVIGDITCDIEGSVELTVKESNLTNPVYVFDPISEQVTDGWEGRGPVILAVDKLPTELPREASESFGEALMPFVPALAGARYDSSIDRVRIPREFKEGMIVHKGKLRPRFRFLQKFLA